MANRVVTLSEVKEILEKEEEEYPDTMVLEKRLALTHAQEFAVLSAEDARKMMEELMEIEGITEEYAAKFTEILPQTPDEVRSVFSREKYGISQEDITKIIDITKKYLK